MVCGPMFGYMAGNSRSLERTMILSAVLNAMAYLILGLTIISPYVGFYMITVASILFQTSAFPAIGMVVNKSQRGAAFGTTMSLCSFVGAIMPLFLEWKEW